MGIQVNFIDNGTGVEIIASGTVHGQDILKIMTELYNSKEFHKQRYQIIDRTECTEYYVSAEEVLAIAELDKKAAKQNNNIAIAIVSPNEMLDSIARLWKHHVDNNVFITEVFLDRATADKWIQDNKK